MANSVQPIRIANIAYRWPLAHLCSADLNTLSAKPKQGCPHPGVANELLYNILSLCRIPYTLYNVLDGHQFGSFQNGTWTGTMGMLENGTLDMINDGLTYTTMRTRYFNYGRIQEDSRIVFVLHRPVTSLWQESTRIITPFTLQTYGVNALCFATFILLLAYIDVCFSFGSGCKRLLLLRFERLLEHQGDGCRVYRSRQLILAMFGFLLLFMTGLYQGVLLAKLFTPPAAPTYNLRMLIDKIANKELTMVMRYPLNHFRERVEAAETGLLNDLRLALVKNPMVFQPNETKLLDLVENHKHVVPIEETRAREYIKKSCNLNYVEMEDVPRQWKAYIFSKHSSIDLHRFNNCTVHFQGFFEVLLERYMRRTFSKESPCLEHQEADNIDVTPLDIPNVLGCFSILLAGLLLATLVVMVEYLVNCCRKPGS